MNRILVTVETVYALLAAQGPGTAHGVCLSLVGSFTHTVRNPPSERPGFSGGRKLWPDAVARRFNSPAAAERVEKRRDGPDGAYPEAR